MRKAWVRKRQDCEGEENRMYKGKSTMFQSWVYAKEAMSIVVMILELSLSLKHVEYIERKEGKQEEQAMAGLQAKEVGGLSQLYVFV